VKKIIIHPDYIIRESEKDKPGENPDCKWIKNLA
jgi:hypothetical protein